MALTKLFINSESVKKPNTYIFRTPIIQFSSRYITRLRHVNTKRIIQNNINNEQLVIIYVVIVPSLEIAFPGLVLPIVNRGFTC